MFRTLRLLVILWFRRSRRLWKCPRCLRWRRWGTEHFFDEYPMLLNMWRLPTCCVREFPRWAYSACE